MAKKIILGFGCFALAVAIFCGGIFVGTRLPSVMFGITPVTEAYVELAPTFISIKQADRNDYEALKTNLNIRMDGEVLKLHYRIEEAKPGKDVDKAKKLLKGVAEHRVKFPPVYGTHTSAKEVKKAVSDILAKYM